MRCPKILMLTVAALLAAGGAFATPYQIDPNHTRIGFAVRHMAVSTVRGEFHDYDAQIDIDEADLTRSSIAIAIETASIDTDVEMRDNDLRSPNFFDAATYPQITFTSKSIARTAAGGYLVTGDLTMHGVTKEVQLPVTLAGPIDLGESLRMGASAELSINRKDWGISWSRVLDNGGLVAADEVTLEIEAELTRPKQAAAGGSR
jgi:polyisoprenoid-binding protein YceI